jgi:hypothetical protein
MIKLIDRGPDNSRIEFSPRSRYSRVESTIQHELISGYTCPICNNVIQALFLTDKPVDIEKYEETRVLSQGEKNSGELLKVIPGGEEPGNYKQSFYKMPDGNAQKITLKNHVINWEGVGSGDRDDLFEVGERCCKYSAVISLMEADVIKDLAMSLGRAILYEQAGKPLPTIEFFEDWLKTEYYYYTLEMKLLRGVGREVPPCTLVKRDVLKNPPYFGLNTLVSKWNTKLDEEEKLRTAAIEEGALLETV